MHLQATAAQVRVWIHLVLNSFDLIHKTCKAAQLVTAVNKNKLYYLYTRASSTQTSLSYIRMLTVKQYLWYAQQTRLETPFWTSYSRSSGHLVIFYQAITGRGDDVHCSGLICDTADQIVCVSSQVMHISHFASPLLAIHSPLAYRVMHKVICR